MNILLMEVNPYMPCSTPISLGYLAAVLREKGHRVVILNVGDGTRLSPHAFEAVLAEIRPALVGFSAYQRNMLIIKGFMRAVKEKDPSIRVILGGPQATFMPSEAMTELPDMDYLCRGEGEVVIQKVVEFMESGNRGEPVPGTTTRLSPDQWAEGGAVDAPEALDVYPSPFLSGVLDLHGLEEAIMLTSRGCPYRCVFCYTPKAFGHRVRYHSVERVLEEMRWLHGRGVFRFWLADPSFSFARDRSEELLRGIVQRGIRARIWLETRADLVDEDLVRLMAMAGVQTLALGLESASDRVLRWLGKGLLPSRVREAVGLARAQGLDVELFSQYGLPGETYEDAVRTLEFVKGCVPVQGNTNAQQMRVYFGTTVHDRFDAFGIEPLDSRRPHYISIGVRYETRWMSSEEIHRIRDLWREASLDGGRRMVS
ncbi:MAG: B12-binding domain-containing radical SAM protein [Thermodesulfobacteriota bacterium]